MTPFDRERLLFTPKSPDSNAIPLIFAFPNEYTIGITSLGYQIVWSKFALRSDVQVSRLFTNIQENLPRNPELLGFSVSWELDYINIFNLLESLDIPLHSQARNDNHPLVFGGGTVLTANPEPFADFFDIILLGDGENLLDNFIDAYQEVRNSNRDRKLHHLATIAGIYVPSLYQVTYENPQGKIAAIAPRNKSLDH